MRIAVSGYFGWGNFGDQLFLDTVIDKHQHIWPDATSVISLTEQPLAPHSTRRVAGALSRVWYTFRVAMGADLLAYCGGSVFTQISGADAVRRWIRPARMQALGVSVGPFNSIRAEREVAKYLAQFESIVFRDSSWKDFPRVGMLGNHRQGGDIAALSSRISRDEKADRRGLVVCPSAAAGQDSATLAEQARQAFEMLSKSRPHVSVTILALNGHPELGDLQLSREVSKLLSKGGIPSKVEDYISLGLQETCDLLTRAELVLSQRLHGAIVAYLSGGKFILADHHPKCKAFVDEIRAEDFISVKPSSPNIVNELEEVLRGDRIWQVSPQEYVAHAREVYFSAHARA